MTEVKLCGMRTLEAAMAGTEAGADYLGFVFANVRRRIEPDAVREITRALGRGRARYVGVFVDPDPEEAERVARHAGMDVVQLSGHEPPGVARAIGLPVIKAVHVRPGEDPIAEIEQYAEVCEMVLLDTYRASVPGGTGATFDWSLAIGASRRYPVMLAGGLSAGNVAEAIAAVRPRAVDVSSGIETDGEKDPEKIRAFVRAVREVSR